VDRDEMLRVLRPLDRQDAEALRRQFDLEEE